MSESTLSTTYTELRSAIGHEMGKGRTVAKWTAEDIVTINLILKRGLRQFYFPPPLGNNRPHQWSFLKPTTTLATVASYTTGTVTITEGDATVTLAGVGATWPTWAYTHGTLVIDDTEYAIASRTSGSEIELAAVWPEDSIAGETFILRHDGNYDLPDDYGGMEGKMSFDMNSPIVIVGEGKMQSLRANDTSRGAPYCAAIRPKTTDGASGQRFEIRFFPIPDAVYTLTYRKVVLPNMLVTSTNESPYGSAQHAETILASCLAVVEIQENNHIRGPLTEYFMERLAASIQIDNSMGPEHLGYCGDNSDAAHREGGRSRTQNYRVTYNGEI